MIRLPGPALPSTLLHIYLLLRARKNLYVKCAKSF
jgi:hypothetical protein